MDPQRRKELKEQAKNYRPAMGVLQYECSETSERFLCAAPNLKARVARIRVQAESESLRNKRFQHLWDEHGEDVFAISTVEQLEYDDETTDYADDLAALLDICLERDPDAQRI